MSCFTRIFRRSRHHQGEERQPQLPSPSGTSHGSATTQEQQQQQQAGTRQQPAAPFFPFTHLGLPFLSGRPAESKTVPSLIDDLRSAGLTFDCMTLSGTNMADADSTSVEPARKKQKRFACDFCTDELEDDDYIRPCRLCQKQICHECAARMFSVALHDHECMPVRCCSRVTYPGVVTGILEPAVLQRYKERFDETTTTNPLYCPVPTCSAFIPPRLQNPVHGKISCHLCATQICQACRKVASEDHLCERREEKNIVDTFKYKVCPKCSSGVMKMYGCSHIRCQCGAHWCWDCQRPMESCIRNPCSGSRADGDESQMSDVEDDLSDEENDDQVQPIQEPAAPQEGAGDQSTDPSPGSILPADELLAPAHAEDSTTAPAPASAEAPPTEASQSIPPAADPASTGDDLEPEFINLDDPDDPDNNWEGMDADFGDEPVEEDFDVWGCQHKFSDFSTDDMPDHWLKDLNKTEDVALECMCCFKTIIVPGKTTVKQKLKRLKKVSKRRGRSPNASATLRRDNGTLDSAQAEEAVKAEEAARQAQEAQAKLGKKLGAYDCRRCGVIYCRACRTAALRRVKKERNAAV